MPSFKVGDKVLVDGFLRWVIYDAFTLECESLRGKVTRVQGDVLIVKLERKKEGLVEAFRKHVRRPRK